ncbi:MULTISPECIES: EamA family transporter [Rhodomicrobium]|uniref:DMT family transporter n=1 Tax=Rhodomicrobium TaxID=1068 RepID=UPI001482682A|nr:MULTISPECIES: EamA family transporter [Rhodomicrobium]
MTIAVDYPAPPRVQAGLPLAIVAFGGSLTGFSGILVRLSEVDPLATGGWRMAIAIIAFLPFFRLAAGSAGSHSRLRLTPILALAGLFFAIDMAFYNWSLQLTSVAHATLIVNLAPVVALAAGFLMFGERFGPAKATGLVAALGGAAIMTLMRADGSGTLAGNGLAALGMLGYAFYLVAVKRACRDHDTFSIMVWSSIVTCVLMFGVAALMGERLLPASANGWLVLIGLGLVSHVFGQGLVAYGMRGAPVGLASILLLTQPVVATISAWVFFDETMGPVEAAGAALVLAGLVIASRARA